MSQNVSRLHESLANRFAARGDWRRAYQHLRSALALDPLTGIYNRRHLDVWLLDAADDFAVALVDLDHFKHVNDTFGHLTGDRVLRDVAGLLAAGLPAGGFCARYGGEEFALVLPGAIDAVRTAELARRRVAAHSRVTVSVGVALPGTDPLSRADGLLYAAKGAGRNTVAYADGDTVRFTTGSH
ncbi:GGDEF domain-containing protein [Amycolatopsis suaedae]|uniref:GGDEF domain-containing protein n=1 Tax=Amycolatopsis suaedae TaxID=2510978 RepID=A0A4Q7JD70_9PSEU|nr:GGDEF domain-containing protein [Amycolatopsis suaedae]RZQ65329.1 GGDEF domain-containing protein [Amycolatopsis suaedae]